jgi:hypothetical protein
MKVSASKTEWPGIWNIGGEFVASQPEVNGEWQLHEGTVEQLFDCEDRWIDTFRTLRDCKEWVREWKERQAAKKR